VASYGLSRAVLVYPEWFESLRVFLTGFYRRAEKESPAALGDRRFVIFKGRG
jgi:hypothetical protein